MMWRVGTVATATALLAAFGMLALPAGAPEVAPAPEHIALDFLSRHTLRYPATQRAIALLIAREAAARRIGADRIAAILDLAWAESRLLHMVHTNDDGSRDWGPLQVNDHWTPAAVGADTAETIRLGIGAYLAFQTRCEDLSHSIEFDGDGATPEDLALWIIRCTARAYNTGRIE